MNRLKQAWLALWGQLEPEVREVAREVEKPVEKIVRVLGEPERVTVYEAVSPDSAFSAYASYGRALAAGLGSYVPSSPSATPRRPDWHGRKFLTCEQAFAECPGAEVRKRTYYRIGKDYYAQPEVRIARVEIQPKPKVAKGKRK